MLSHPLNLNLHLMYKKTPLICPFNSWDFLFINYYFYTPHKFGIILQAYNSMYRGMWRSRWIRGSYQQHPTQTYSSQMINRLILVMLVLSWSTLCFNNPYIIAGIFSQVLLLTSCIIRRIRKLLGFILFLVYVGGLIVLIRYCVILIPSIKVGVGLVLTSVCLVSPLFFSADCGALNTYSYGLIYSARLVLLVSIVLYMVILAIIDIVDFSAGIMK